MQEMANSLIDTGAQCWACGVFDALFAVISTTAAAAYQRLTLFGVIIFCVLLTFYVVNAVWQNIKKGGEDSTFQQNIKPVVIKSLIALSLLSLGLMVPRLISTITFEPAAMITLEYAKSMLPADYVIPEYTNAIALGDDGFFNPELRDTILKIMEASVANFQVFIKIGIGIMDAAFSLSGLLGIGALIRHIIIFYIGLFLTYNFAKLFVKYSFCFMDVIVAMAMFAFFFPLSVVFFVFKDAKDLPGWMKNLGGDLGTGQIKKLVNAIVSMASTILTYTVIMLLIRGFLTTNGVDADSIQNSAEAMFDFDLDNSSAMEITFAGSIVLVYILNYISTQVPEVTKKIMEAFGVKQENSLSNEMGENMWNLTNIVAGKAKDLAKIIINPESAKKTDDKEKSTNDNKDNKNESKKEDKK